MSRRRRASPGYWCLGEQLGCRDPANQKSAQVILSESLVAERPSGAEELPERAKRNAVFGPPSLPRRERTRAATRDDL